MPEGAHKKIRSVKIYVNHYLSYGVIEGFSFIDGDGKILLEIGNTYYGYEEVLIADGEVIIGVRAKLYPGNQSYYTDLQFEVSKMF